VTRGLDFGKSGSPAVAGQAASKRNSCRELHCHERKPIGLDNSRSARRHRPSGCGTASTTSHAQPAPSVTKTSVRTVTKTVIKTVKVPVPGPTVTVKVPEPGPTVTVNGDTAKLQADKTCIDALFQNIQGWKSSGMIPNGWWDARCPMP